MLPFMLFAAVSIFVCLFGGIVCDRMKEPDDAFYGVLFGPIMYMISFLLTSLVLAVFFGIHV